MDIIFLNKKVNKFKHAEKKVQYIDNKMNVLSSVTFN